MGRPSHLNWLFAACFLLAGCSSSELKSESDQQLNDVKGTAPPSDSKTPAGPIRSLTLRLGTDDDRLRLYWGDGQTSDLACSQEGKGTWACG